MSEQRNAGGDDRRFVSQSEGASLRERPVGELFSRLSEDLSTLIRQELALARAELTEKGREAGKGAGLLGGAGVVGLLAGGALTAGLVLLLDLAVAAWLAAFIVAAVYGAIAAVLARRGRDQVKQAGPPVPEQTVETIEEDVEWVKTRARSAPR